MAKLSPAARPQVKGDTQDLPIPNGGVYFRNNVGAFRMEGETIDRWIEALLPMFDGRFTLAELTDGLPSLHRERVFDIADVLYTNGFIRDASQDRPHGLHDRIMQKYAAQIAFLDNFGDSGAYRFQCYRQTETLAVGSGPMFVSLVEALLASGLPKLRMLIAGSVPTDRNRLAELAEQARRSDPEVLLIEIDPPEDKDGLHAVVQPFQAVVYVSQDGNADDIRLWQAVCQAEKKRFLPAVCLHQTGMAGPVVHPDSEGCWESAWRRIRRTAVYKDPQRYVFSPAAGTMLANVVAFELFKTVTGDAPSRPSCFLLDLETFEGDWHTFLPHPSVLGYAPAKETEIVREGLEGSAEKAESGRLLAYFNQLTSAQTGIIHRWEEGDLRQLPLCQCRVQTADPLSEGPAGLLPELVCSALTHEEARREAGLAGIEAYAARLSGVLLNTAETIGFGAGGTKNAAVWRGLQANLTERLAGLQRTGMTAVKRVHAIRVEDEECRFYLKCLTAINGTPRIGLGEKAAGFPAVWVGMGKRWFGGIGLNTTLAFRKALKAALHSAQNHTGRLAAEAAEASSVRAGEETLAELAIPAAENMPPAQALQEAVRMLSANGKRLYAVDLAAEPFLKETLAGVFGVFVREEGPR